MRTMPTARGIVDISNNLLRRSDAFIRTTRERFAGAQRNIERGGASAAAPKFDSAAPLADGYAQPAVADVVVRKTAALTTPDRIDAPLVSGSDVRLATVAGVAATAGNRVLDFGGAAGFHYRVARRAFPERNFRWAVVETPLMVSRARELETEALRFFTTIEDAATWLGGVDLVHSAGALQFAPEPERTLGQLVALSASGMVWTRLQLGAIRETVTNRARLSDNGPGPMPAGVPDFDVIFQLITVRENDFLEAHRGYRLVWRDESRGFLFLRH